MLDQVEALKFINEEIFNFGGDPTKITIFGESAGSASVSAHTYSPLSQPYFQQGIQESGAILPIFEGTLGFSNQNFLFAQEACNYTVDQWNSANYTALKSCLMNINTSSGIHFSNIVGGKISNPGWTMVQDNYFLPDVPRNLAKNRTNKPVIIGTNKDEFDLMLGPMNANQSLNFNKNQSKHYLTNLFADFLGNHTQMVMQMLENLYLDPGVADDDHVAWLEYIATVSTSLLFTGFVARDAELHLLYNNTNVYMYQFSYWAADVYPFTEYTVPGWQPVPHFAEIPFVFFWKLITESETSMTNIKIGNFFGETWTNFAKYGKPTMDDTWTRTKSLLNNMEYIDINQNPTMKSGYRAIDQVLVNRLLPTLIGIFPPEMPDYNNGSIIPTGAPPTGTLPSGSTTTSAQFFTIFIIAMAFKSLFSWCLEF